MEPGIYIVTAPGPDDMWRPGWWWSMNNMIGKVFTIKLSIPLIQQADHWHADFGNYYYLNDAYFKASRCKKIASISQT